METDTVTAMDHLADPTDKAWHLLAVLLRLGRPVPVSALADGRITADFVEYLCQIPGSPLLLTDDRRVMLSRYALLAFIRFISLSPFVEDLDGERRFWDGSFFWSRKRKRKETKANVLEHNFKRPRSLPLQSHWNEYEGVDLDNSLTKRIQGNHASDEDMQLALNNSSFSLSIDSCMCPNVMIMKQHVTISSLLPNIELLSNDFWSDANHNRRGCNIELRDDRTTAMIVHKQLFSMYDSGKKCCSDGNAKKEATTMKKEKCAHISKADIIPKPSESMTCPLSILESFGDKMHAHQTCVMSENNMDLNVVVQEPRKETSDAGSDVHLSQNTTKRIMMDDATTAEISYPFKNTGFDSGHAERGTSLATTALPDHDANKMEAIPIPSFSKLSLTSKKIHVKTKPGDMKKKDTSYVKKRNQAKGYVDGVQKKTRTRNKISNETGPGFDSKAEKTPVETRKLPQFESFVAEEEEGSGGYGTVYRARRKTDGKTFAIKYPHPKAHSYHINNELKMLEQFGGKSFIIKFEGSFKSGNSECFILEHVKHDRPEILKKAIDITELQWYGYCMFKALLSLHKHQIVHRDVKPGNFLFSRELNKGYLIDFNLALDLHHKHRCKSDSKTKDGIGQFVSHIKLSTQSHSKKSIQKHVEVDKIMNNGSRKLLSPTNTRKDDRSDACNALDSNRKGKYGSQAADASGLTSTRTSSVEKSKFPILWNVRKELKSLVQEVMQSSNQKTSPCPTSHRKRIAAPIGRVERLLASLTPMPLYSNGIAISNAGTLKDKDDVQHKTEGPCVGTKGYRAPEVLLKSLHQGCKVDTWSAGVTLLYLIIGRSPFGGDPEQNIKEIAKLRGSEDLWEVAKLHNRDSSFPRDLFDVQSLQPMELKTWCQKNTRRPEFFEMIPDTLFDLIDKCLTVNPRLRISSEEALMHDFFSPCRESLKKQRRLRLSYGSPVEKEGNILIKAD